MDQGTTTRLHTVGCPIGRVRLQQSRRTAVGASCCQGFSYNSSRSACKSFGLCIFRYVYQHLQDLYRVWPPELCSELHLQASSMHQECSFILQLEGMYENRLTHILLPFVLGGTTASHLTIKKAIARGLTSRLTKPCITGVTSGSQELTHRCNGTGKNVDILAALTCCRES